MKNQIEIRPVSESQHLEELRQLAHAIWHEHYPGIISRAQIRYMLGKRYSLDALQRDFTEGGIHFDRALIGEDLIGYSAYGPRTEAGELMLHSLYVRLDVRRGGCGRKLFERVVDYACTRGFSKIFLTVNQRNRIAIKVYERLGFRICGPILTDIGSGFVMDDHLMMLCTPKSFRSETSL